MVRVTRRQRSPSKLETRPRASKLAVRRKPYVVLAAPGIFLAYRRNAGAGVWSVKASDGHGKYWLKRFAIADDHEDANGETVLDFFQARDKAARWHAVAMKHRAVIVRPPSPKLWTPTRTI